MDEILTKTIREHSQKEKNCLQILKSLEKKFKMDNLNFPNLIFIPEKRTKDHRKQERSTKGI